MGDFTFTKHAEERFQQRGFKNDIYDFLMEYGESTRAHNECFILEISKKELSLLEVDKSVDQVTRDFIRANFDKIVKKKVVISEASVVTFYNAA